VLVCGTVAGLIAPAWTATVAPYPFVIALLLFGTPHGAADWTVAARLSNRVGLAARLSGFAGYLLLMAASLGFMMWQPGMAALLFLLLTVFHFGMADATAVGADDEGFVARWGLVLGRGQLLLATAFASHPSGAWAPFAEIGEALAFGGRFASPWMPPLDALRAWARVGVAAGALCAVCSAFARIRRGSTRAALLDLAEAALVVALTLLTDPLFAVGCFFLGVHAFRHMRRLACTSVVIAPPPKSLLKRIVRVHAISLPLMLPTAACLLPLCWLLGGFGAREIAVASIAFYMITTLPHHLLGLRLPRADLAPATS
jgi:Brp/Blh family beta-carotene 15,15'-monooxygenase